MRSVLHIQKVKYIAGSENHLLMLLPRLHEYGYEPKMLILADSEDRPEAFCQRMRASGIPTEVMGIRGDLDVLLLWRLRQYIHQGDFDLIHTHLFHADLYGSLAGRLANISTIISTHHGFNTWRSNKFYAWLDRLVARFQKSIITISNAIGQWLVKVEGLPAEKMVTIHYGLDADVFRAQANNKPIALDVSSPIIGTVSRLISSKGIDILLQAFAQVSKTYPNASLIIVGDGPERDSLHRLTNQLQIAQKTHFLGNRDDVSSLMREFELFVFPTFGEGFGLVLLEAMAWGKPIAATDVMAIPEIVIPGETGLLVPQRDSILMAEAIVTLLDDEKYARYLGRKGKERLEEVFTVDRMVEQTAQLYNRVLVSVK